ncbi:alternative ribosome rescue aminoacyl-tRNA hydrolase ArfB [Candidatus Uabimicrobium amorphum]|uniref:Aminoacyl-tRNA hydrolase n=1 Tax=Uabimicrobium amorphum TaxID=2596890 RepID=A0A5S9IU64_UABAM|nr:alternative ribosome rescue aminoacyl-tRNA hydrolase ArfB [Candidatus Uabimicrobium amorphum]BBM87837.1 aminoacyl-tRNA hydrolase [Candidatus Uabimicrobium amorphum]
MSEKDIVVNSRLTIPWKEIEISHSRCGGPGGQNVNKLNTKVQLKWLMSTNLELDEDIRTRILEKCASYVTKSGDVQVCGTQYRSQKRNLEYCIEHLREILLKAFIVKKARKKKKMPRAVKERILRNKKMKSQKKKMRQKVTD